jgi:hypothetical protein
MMRVRLARERTDDLAHPARLYERGDASLTVAGVVDDGQVADAARD